jgi:hypothetical protein
MTEGQQRLIHQWRSLPTQTRLPQSEQSTLLAISTDPPQHLSRETTDYTPNIHQPARAVSSPRDPTCPTTPPAATAQRASTSRIFAYQAPSKNTPATPTTKPARHSPHASTTQQNSPTTPGDIEEAYEQLDQVQPLPRPAPQRLNSASSQSQDPGLHIPTINTSRSATSSNASLPLRGYAEPLKSPDLRTTVLDRRLDKLSLTTPKTGVPYTPYSPYMPFTPLTPVTPHLVTKKERKSRAKEDKRKGTGGEMVQSPKDMFGDGW